MPVAMATVAWNLHGWHSMTLGCVGVSRGGAEPPPQRHSMPVAGNRRVESPWLARNDVGVCWCITRRHGAAESRRESVFCVTLRPLCALCEPVGILVCHPQATPELLAV
jgi:hypothetical protein